MWPGPPTPTPWQQAGAPGAAPWRGGLSFQPATSVTPIQVNSRNSAVCPWDAASSVGWGATLEGVAGTCLAFHLGWFLPPSCSWVFRRGTRPARSPSPGASLWSFQQDSSPLPPRLPPAPPVAPSLGGGPATMGLPQRPQTPPLRPAPHPTPLSLEADLVLQDRLCPQFFAFILPLHPHPQTLE